MEKRNVIAIMGIPGSGKTEVIQYLLAVYRLPMFSFKAVLEEEIRRNKVPLGYMGSREIRKRLEGELGEEYFPKRIIELIDTDITHENALVEGLDLEGRVDVEVLTRRFGPNLHTITIHTPITNVFREFLHDAKQVMQLEEGGPLAASNHLVVNDGDLTKMMNILDAIMLGYGIAKP